jgi:hypothetical protein
MMPISDPIRVVKKVTDVLDELGIRYLIGGSLASSLYGVPRATQDVDIVADFSESQLEKLNGLLSGSFFIDIEMAKDAVKRRSSFNIVDKEYFFKIDVFMQGSDDLSATEMDRRVLYTLAESGDQTIYICSPEDIIAHKLHWYRLGGGVSERQWNDALNVVKVQKGRLDLDYLNNVCRKRRVYDLLEKLLTGYND